MATLKERLKKKRGEQENIESPLFGRKQLITDTIKQEMERFKGEIMQEMKNVVKELVGKKGVNSLKGERGHTPQFGIDFLRPEEMAKLRGERGERGADGISADEDTVIKRVLKRIPRPKKVKPVEIKELVGKELARMLETLRGTSEALDYFALRNRPTIEDSKGKRTLHRGGQGLTVRASDLSSQTDGSTKTFTIPVHTRSISLTGSDFPYTYRLTTDYTTSGVVLTITSAPDAPTDGSTLWFVYAV